MKVIDQEAALRLHQEGKSLRQIAKELGGNLLAMEVRRALKRCPSYRPHVALRRSRLPQVLRWVKYHREQLAHWQKIAAALSASEK